MVVISGIEDRLVSQNVVHFLSQYQLTSQIMQIHMMYIIMNTRLLVVISIQIIFLFQYQLNPQNHSEVKYCQMIEFVVNGQSILQRKQNILDTIQMALAWKIVAKQEVEFCNSTIYLIKKFQSRGKAENQVAVEDSQGQLIGQLNHFQENHEFTMDKSQSKWNSPGLFLSNRKNVAVLSLQDL